ncbi:MAG: hypothetical protein OXF01_00925, partial [Gemmatimonadetes bacterium]|nr:hypothetical protein [Gemmatimonadota bacterium]
IAYSVNDGTNTGTRPFFIDVVEPPALSVVVDANPMTIMEGRTSTITATANRPVTTADGAVAVALTVVGEATLDKRSIPIAVGQMSGTATLTSTADADYEPDTVEVTVTGDDVADGHPNIVITVTDDAPPRELMVTVSAAPMTIEEGGTSTITAMANRAVLASDGTVTINLSVVGDATLSAESITIAAGEESGTVTLTATEDDDYEDETVTVVASGTGVVGNEEIEITVTDNDQPPAKLRGQITAMKMMEDTPRGRQEVDRITVGGTPRYHTVEGDNDKWLAVTVQWRHEELLAIAGATQYVNVEIKHRRPGLPIAGVNWVSWIDEEGDADFPQGSTLGRLQARVSLTPPPAPDGSTRHINSATGYVRVLLPVDHHEAENDAFFIEAIGGDVDLDATAAVNLTTPVVIIEDETPQEVTVIRKVGEPPVIYEGAPSPASSSVAGQALYTVSAKPARIDLPLEVRMDLLDPDGAVRTGNVSLSHSAVTLNSRMDGMGNSHDVYLALPIPDGDRVDNDYTLQASVVDYSLRSGGEENTESPTSLPVTVVDRHKLPWLTVAGAMSVMEGDEDGVDLTLTINRNPANTIATDPEMVQYTSEALRIVVNPSGDANASDYTLSMNPIRVDEDEKTVKVNVRAHEDDDIGDKMLTLEFVVEGTVDVNGPRPREDDDGLSQTDHENSMAEMTLTITDETEKLVWARTADQVEAAVNAAVTTAGGGDGLNPEGCGSFSSAIEKGPWASARSMARPT